MQISALQEAYQCKGKVACCENGKPIQALMSAHVWSDTLKLGPQTSHQNAVTSCLWKMLGSPRAPVPGWPGRVPDVGRDSEGRTLVIEKKETQIDRVFWRMRRNQWETKTGKWGWRKWRPENEQKCYGKWIERREKSGVYGMCSTPHMRNYKPEIWKLVKEKNLKISVSALTGRRPQALSPLNTAECKHFFWIFAMGNLFSSLWTGSYGDMFKNRSKL